MERVGVWEWILVDQGPVQGEVLEVSDSNLFDAATALPKLVSENVHEDRLQPAAAGRLLLQAPEGSVALQQGLLHQVLRTVSHEPARQRVEPRELLADELLVGVLRPIPGGDPTHLRSTRHALAFQGIDVRRDELIASGRTGNGRGRTGVLARWRR